MLPIGDENLGQRRRPIVNYALIGTCIAVFALQELVPGDSEALVRTWGLVPARLLNDGPVAAHTLITHMFLHGNLLHIGGNMLFLWVFGDNIEDEFGHIPYLLFYLGTGVLAGLASVALRATSDVPGIGASGAISGVLGAYLVLFPLNEIRVVILHPFTLLLWLGSLFLQNRPELPKIGVSALYVLLFYLIYNFIGALAGIVSPSRVDSVAHLGGFLGGYLIVLILRGRFGLWPDTVGAAAEGPTASLRTGMADRQAEAERLQEVGNWPEARKTLEAALKKSELTDDIRSSVSAHLQLAEVLAHQEELDVAAERVAAGRTLAQENGYGDLVARADLVAGRVALQTNNAASAEKLLQSALEWARSETYQTLPTAQTILAAAELADQLGDTRHGLTLRREAVQGFIQARDRRRAVDVLVEIGDRLAATGDFPGARDARREGLRIARAIYYVDAMERLSAELEAPGAT
ncbi:MAG: hypothetical protein CL878_10095 [Dehalococcoidia bacterium]|nr:hypothetical protein [Dehalococcoidia bacterium]